MDGCSLIFEPSGQRYTGAAGATVLEMARDCGVNLTTACGGHETCGKCRVRVMPAGGPLVMNAATAAELRVLGAVGLTEHWRLACCVHIQGQAVIEVPRFSQDGEPVILAEGQRHAAALRPWIQFYMVTMTPPTLQDHRSDFRRLQDSLRETYPAIFRTPPGIAYEVLQQLPGSLRQSGWQVLAGVAGGAKIVGIKPAGEPLHCYGVSVDMGTTTLAAGLTNLVTGKQLAAAACVNHQVRFGDDVITRISYAVQQPDGLRQLQEAVVADCNALLDELVQKAGIQNGDIYEIVLAGNTVMKQLFFGIMPDWIGKSPFVAAIQDAVTMPAARCGIQIAPAGRLYFLPGEAGFVGSDNVAVLLAGESYKQEKMTLTVDIGTNGEIDFGNRQEMFSASCATGPALEGAQLRFGMRAASGAVAHVQINPVTLRASCSVIGGGPACGICGSGIVDAVAELVRTGVVQVSGVFNKLSGHPLVRRREGKKKVWEYVLVPAALSGIGQDITITQQDIRAVQLAKAALWAGAALLVEKSGGRPIERVVLAGAFGSYIDRHNALAIGLLPDCDEDCIVVVGNAAGEGARLVLIDQGKRREAAALAPWVKFVEAAAEKSFQRYFLQGMEFRRLALTETRDDRGRDLDRNTEKTFA